MKTKNLKNNTIESIVNRVIEDCYEFQDGELSTFILKAQESLRKNTALYFKSNTRIQGIKSAWLFWVIISFAVLTIAFFPREIIYLVLNQKFNKDSFVLFLSVYIFVLWRWYYYFFVKKIQGLRWVAKSLLRINNKLFADGVRGSTVLSVKKVPLVLIKYRIIETLRENVYKSNKEFFNEAQSIYAEYLFLLGIPLSAVPNLWLKRKNKFVFWSVVLTLVLLWYLCSINSYPKDSRSFLGLYIALALYVYYFFLFPRKQLIRLIDDVNEGLKKSFGACE